MSDPVVEVTEGKIRGIAVKNVDGGEYLAFRGIPYAEPPIGNLRFKDPRPPQAWSGVRDAQNVFPKGAQYDILTGIQSGSEDCLYVNVATNSLMGKRPVMAWIHGGAFHTGWPTTSLYEPDYLVNHDIVLVGITYRLGCFGFLNLDLPDASGNQALKDQVAALRWIQKNIGAFGGDPENVTLFGHSAGAACIHLISLSPLAKGLFHKAILQSSVAINPWAMHAEPVKCGLKLAEEAKKKTNDPVEALKYLMTLSTAQLNTAQETMQDASEMFELMLSFTPSVDAKSNEPFMPETPIEMIMKHGIDVPVIVGFTNNDGILMMQGPKGAAFREINTNFASHLAKSMRIRDVESFANVADTVKKYYFGEYMASLAEHKNAYAQLKGDVNFVNGIQQFIDVQSEKSTPTYTYKFSYVPSCPTIRKRFKLHIEGSCHGDDLHSLFHCTIYGSNTAHAEGTSDRLIMERMTRMWTDFAKTGNPTPEINELIPCKWEPIMKDKRNCLEINVEMTPGVNANGASWKFWKPIFETLQWRVGG